MWLWCWLRWVPIGCYERQTLLDYVNVGCWCWKAALGARKCLSLWATKRCGVDGEWERGRLQTFRFLSSWFSFTSAFLLRLVAATRGHWKDVGPFSWNFQLSCCSNILQTQERLFWIHVVDTNTRLTNLLLNQSTPITTMFIPHDCATEQWYIITYWYHM